MHVKCEYLYKSHVHCLDNHTNFTVVEAKAHESSLYAQRSTANGLSDFKVCALSLCHIAPGSPHSFEASFCPLPSTCDKFLASFKVKILKENKLLALRL